MSHTIEMVETPHAPLSRVVYVLGGFKLLMHLLTAAHYPLHRDELYYLMCGRHPSWGYPDHPPLVPWLASATEYLFGASAFWLRLWPAIVGAVLVILAAWMARRFGGGRLAQVLAGLAVVFSPLYLLSNSMLQTVSLDQLWWTASAAVLVAIIGGHDRRLFLLLGLLLGLGLLAKLTILAWGLGLLIGLMATRQRALLRSPWLWAGAVLTAVVAAPMIFWQAEHGWPVLQFITHNRDGEVVRPWTFLVLAAAMTGPIMGVLLLGHGFKFLLGREVGGRWRALGLATAVAWAVFLVTGGKPYYMGPTLPLLFAGGAVALERHLARNANQRAKTGAIVLLVSQVWMVPFFLPVIPRAQLGGMVEYLPHDDWQNMFGWKEVAGQIADVVRQLPPDEQDGLRILAANYGIAGAVDVYGPAMGLPAAVCGHNAYAFWEKAPTLDPLIAVGYDRDWLRQQYSEVRPMGDVTGDGVFGNEDTGDPITYCRGLLRPAAGLWSALRHFD